MFLSNEMNSFLQCKTDFHVFDFFAEKVILSLNAQNHFFRASKNTKLCLVQLSKYENARPQMLKNFFLSEKKLLNAILRAKLKYMKNVSF